MSSRTYTEQVLNMMHDEVNRSNNFYINEIESLRRRSGTVAAAALGLVSIAVSVEQVGFCALVLASTAYGYTICLCTYVLAPNWGRRHSVPIEQMSQLHARHADTSAFLIELIAVKHNGLAENAALYGRLRNVVQAAGISIVLASLIWIAAVGQIQLATAQ